MILLIYHIYPWRRLQNCIKLTFPNAGYTFCCHRSLFSKSYPKLFFYTPWSLSVWKVSAKFIRSNLSFILTAVISKLILPILNKKIAIRFPSSNIINSLLSCGLYESLFLFEMILMVVLSNQCTRHVNLAPILTDILFAIKLIG